MGGVGGKTVADGVNVSGLRWMAGIIDVNGNYFSLKYDFYFFLIQIAIGNNKTETVSYKFCCQSGGERFFR
ncbi:hypothetical protein HLB25_02810 [Dickeya dadantii]|uniref:hypothetical protein n=1 Tax=Dickeya dadantii TaxID=204038 RepID=UPI001495C0E4|nr:hypothetical protein [Dickeya dadantii]MCL6406862.1 hypothetical protein [Dickeya dadantii]NPE57231.1 hypothetical protein [Dickeya dadantii]NPE65796.1 hypothetical protein [Dickeya dadantii]